MAVQVHGNVETLAVKTTLQLRPFLVLSQRVVVQIGHSVTVKFLSYWSLVRTSSTTPFCDKLRCTVPGTPFHSSSSR